MKTTWESIGGHFAEYTYESGLYLSFKDKIIPILLCFKNILRISCVFALSISDIIIFNLYIFSESPALFTTSCPLFAPSFHTSCSSIVVNFPPSTTIFPSTTTISRRCYFWTEESSLFHFIYRFSHLEPCVDLPHHYTSLSGTQPQDFPHHPS